MKTTLMSIFLSLTMIVANAQLKKDGTPDMRYKANKQIYGNSYTNPSYNNPSYSSPSLYNPYPTKQDGTPDMRYKSNRDLYGTSNSNYSSNGSYYTVPSPPNTTKGYTKSSGTYVPTYFSTKKNNTNTDNYSTSGNINPYTGTPGYRAQDKSPEAFNYGAGYEIKSGERGGQYYINRMGKKTYVPKRY